MVGMGKFSRKIVLLRSFGSRQILIFPFFFGTANIEEIQGVGFDNGSMTLALCNS